MNLQHLPEPELEFASSGRHVDIKFGLMNHGPLDCDTRDRSRSIRLGIIGSPTSVDNCLAWLNRCRDEVPAKESRYGNLFPRFPGFRPDAGFRAEIDCQTRMQRRIPVREFVGLTKETDYNHLLEAAASLFVEEARYLVQETGVEVIACAVPPELLRLIDKEEGNPDGPTASAQGRWQFHDLLKARGMVAGRPIQMIRPSTFGGSKAKAAPKTGRRVKGTQDEATRAWNIHTALYYKAKGIPWRLPRAATDLMTCHVGISFYRTLDRESVHTSMAQVFNQRGQGVIVRGGQAQVSKDDRTPHLSEQDSYQLLLGAIKTYRKEHSTYPARVVVHKSSSYDGPERTGFRGAVSELGIEYCDLVTVRESFTRLFRV